MEFVYIPGMIPRQFGNEWWYLFWNPIWGGSYLRIGITVAVHRKILPNFSGTRDLRNDLILSNLLRTTEFPFRYC